MYFFTCIHFFINYMEIILELEIYFMYTSMMRINLNIICKYIYTRDVCAGEQSFDNQYNLINSAYPREKTFLYARNPYILLFYAFFCSPSKKSYFRKHSSNQRFKTVAFLNDRVRKNKTILKYYHAFLPRLSASTTQTHF